MVCFFFLQHHILFDAGIINLSETQVSNGDDNNILISPELNESLHLEYLEQSLAHSNLSRKYYLLFLFPSRQHCKCAGSGLAIFRTPDSAKQSLLVC